MNYRRTPGRNDPCPCQSGKKFKHCCLNRRIGNLPPPPQMLTEIEPDSRAKHAEYLQRESERLHRLGRVKHVIRIDHGKQRLVAVGNTLTWQPIDHWKTFIDFLLYDIVRVLGKDWIVSEHKKSLQERHEILKWYDAFFKQPKIVYEKEGLVEAIPTGLGTAYIRLAYDLYVLGHHIKLQQSVVKRLKDRDNFQGARHELFAAATFIRAGYNLEHEDESDRSKGHAEFVAVYEKTGLRIAVEAKSRHLSGVLGFQGVVPRNQTPKVDIRGLLNKANKKPVNCPYVIFIDMNMPPSERPLDQREWIQTVEREMLRRASRKSSLDPFTMIVFTNFPFHYGKPDEPVPTWEIFVHQSSRPKHPFPHLDVVKGIQKALEQHDNIPSSWDEVE